MHIAYWSPAWPLEKFQNGIVSYVHWMKHEMERRGHRVSVLTSYLDQETTEARLHWVRRSPWDRAWHRILGRPTPREIRVFSFSRAISTALSNIHRREPIDIIEMEESFGWFADVTKRTSIPLLVKLHGPAFLSLVEEEITSRSGQERIVREGLALERARAIVGVSKRTLEQTIERYNLKPRTLANIALPVPTSQEAPLWRLGDCDKATILFVGRVDLRKGADILLKAFRTLLESRPTLKLIFVGPDGELPGPEGERLAFNRYCDALFPSRLRQQIDYRGRLPFTEIQVLRARAMTTVVASRWENQPYTVLEAMLQGVPVVCTDAGGCPEIVAHGLTGRLARSEDPSNFAAQIEYIISNPKEAEKMGLAARERILKYHSAAKIAEESLALYERIIAEHR
jgi:glycosyltransferase involved in cell wall biosynthesis